VVTDGPYAESKDLVTGSLIVEAPPWKTPSTWRARARHTSSAVRFLGAGARPRRRQPPLRWLDLALRPGSARPVQDRGQALLRLVGGIRGGAPTAPVSTFLPRSPGQFVDPPRRTGGCLSARPPIWGMSNEAAMASLYSQPRAACVRDRRRKFVDNTDRGNKPDHADGGPRPAAGHTRGGLSAA
jgi:hypothetical protein